jgi:hypothetical protein
MMTSVAVIPTGPRYIPYGWVFVVVVILLIMLIFIRVYGRGDRSRRRTAHRSGRRTAHRSRRRTAHRASRVPERGGNHGHRAASRRRPDRP